MKKTVVAVAIGLLAATAPVMARASGATFAGGCGITAVQNSDGSWSGVGYLAVVATDASGVPTGGAVTASCDLVINGVPYATVFGPASGAGAVFAAGPTPSFAAGPSDIVTWCVHVTTWWTEDSCGPITAVSGVPGVAGDVLDTVNDVLVAVTNLANDVLELALGLATQVLAIVTGLARDLVIEPFDPLTCSVLITLAPWVNLVFNDALIDIDEHSGDLVVYGYRYHDCPPYED